MKNLATCKPSEFIAQTAKIKGALASWIKAIDLMNIRATQPKYEVFPLDSTPEQRAEIIKKNAELQKQQTMENLSKILDNMLVEHPQETLNVLALCCFVEPEHVDDYSISDYMSCVMEMMQNKSVMDFFSLLAQMQTVAKSI
jgi:hypothetical protein